MLWVKLNFCLLGPGLLHRLLSFKQTVAHRTLISISQSSDLTRPGDVGSRLGLRMALQARISSETEGWSFVERVGIAQRPPLQRLCALY